MNKPPDTPRGRRILWVHVLTVVSAAILIGAEVFGAAFAAGWALAHWSGLGEYAYGTRIVQGMLFLLGAYVMVQFLRAAQRVEPFTVER